MKKKLLLFWHLVIKYCFYTTHTYSIPIHLTGWYKTRDHSFIFMWDVDIDKEKAVGDEITKNGRKAYYYRLDGKVISLSSPHDKDVIEYLGSSRPETIDKKEIIPPTITMWGDPRPTKSILEISFMTIFILFCILSWVVLAWVLFFLV